MVLRGAMTSGCGVGGMMRIRTAVCTVSDPEAAVQDIANQLDVVGQGAPDFAALYFSADIDANTVQQAALGKFGPHLHGGTSCLGVMSDQGLAVGPGIGAFAIWDPKGSFGTASADLGRDPRVAGRTAAREALIAAGRDGEAPDLVWLTLAPGTEESVLAGVKDVVGADTPIVGGTSGDNDHAGAWHQISAGGCHSNGVVVTVLFPSRNIAVACQTGFAPTENSGMVTGADGRTLHSIDGAPAAQVYAGWTATPLPPPDQRQSIMSTGALHPLGHEVGFVAGVPMHLLAQPGFANPDGSLSLFADVAPGDRLWLMHGSAAAMVDRAGRVVAQARRGLPDGGDDIAGALVVYCAGSLLLLRDRGDDVRQAVHAALGGAPFMGVFTFGEQGSVLGGESRHGNLMVACSVFG